MSLLFQTSEQSRLLVNHDWKISYFNASVANAFSDQYKQKLQAGFNFKDYIDLPLLPFFQESFASALEGEEIQSKKIIEIEGKEYWFQFSFYVILE